MSYKTQRTLTPNQQSIFNQLIQALEYIPSNTPIDDLIVTACSHNLLDASAVSISLLLADVIADDKDGPAYKI